MVYRVTLASCGNPDYGQDPSQPLPGVPDAVATIASLSRATDRVPLHVLVEASRICRQYIESNELGSGNWAGGDILNKDGQVVARVSYNGKVWPVPDCDEHGKKLPPLYTP